MRSTHIPSYPEAFDKDYSQMYGFPISSGGSLLVDIVKNNAEYSVFQYWILKCIDWDESTAIAFCETFLLHSHISNPLILQSIEVKPEYRGIGLSHDMIRQIEKFHEQKMWSNGMYTAEGKKKLGFVPIFSDYSTTTIVPPTAFVLDWINLVAKNEQRFRTH